MSHFLNNLDGLSMALAIVLFLVMLTRVMGKSSRTEHSLWFAGSSVLLVVSFLAGREHNLLYDPYISTFALLALSLFAIGFVATADPERRFTPYFALYLAVVTLIYSFASHYDGVTREVLRSPSFLFGFVPAVGAMAVVPLKRLAQGAPDLHRLWVPASAVLFAVAARLTVLFMTEALALEEAAVKPTLYSIIGAGIAFLILGLTLVKEWQPADS